MTDKINQKIYGYVQRNWGTTNFGEINIEHHTTKNKYQSLLKAINIIFYKDVIDKLINWVSVFVKERTFPLENRQMINAYEVI